MGHKNPLHHWAFASYFCSPCNSSLSPFSSASPVGLPFTFPLMAKGIPSAAATLTWVESLHSFGLSQELMCLVLLLRRFLLFLSKFGCLSSLIGGNDPFFSPSKEGFVGNFKSWNLFWCLNLPVASFWKVLQSKWKKILFCNVTILFYGSETDRTMLPPFPLAATYFISGIYGFDHLCSFMTQTTGDGGQTL